MVISAVIKNEYRQNDITVSTNGHSQKINIPGKAEGWGSSVNGGELLFLALATCFCNDVYREAARRKMEVSSVEVTVSGEFGGEGEAAAHIVYEAKVLSSSASRQEVDELVRYVDRIAEIHNTLRKGVPVSLKG